MIGGLVFGLGIGMCLPRLCRRIDAWLNRCDTADPEAIDAFRRIYERGRR